MIIFPRAERIDQEFLNEKTKIAFGRACNLFASYRVFEVMLMENTGVYLGITQTNVGVASHFPKRARKLLWIFLWACGITAQAVNMLTWQNGLDRTGQNTNETILTTSNVNSKTFGKLFSYGVDGYVFAQPVYLSGVSIPGKGVYNVVFVVTEHDAIYAFDADNNSGTSTDPLWHVSFADSARGISSIPISDVGLSDPPELGMTSTPVIDPVSGTIYVLPKTKEVIAGQVVHAHRLHALDVHTGAEKFGGPVLLEASVPGTGDSADGNGNVHFDPFNEFNRPGLALVNGVIYCAFGSQGDIEPVHGWVLGYDAASLKQTAAYCTTPNGGLGGIWMSGAAPSADEFGNLYVITGNGTFGVAEGDYGDSFLKLTPSKNQINVTGFFTPFNQQWMQDNDVDLGSGGAILLPDSVGNAQHRHLMVSCGKEAKLYLADRDNLGGYNSITDQVLQFVQGPTNAAWSSAAYFNGNIYMIGFADSLKMWSVSNARLSSNPVGKSSIRFGYPGATPFISANGTNEGIVWALQADGYDSQSPGILRAFNATDVTQQLYSSSDADQRDVAGPAQKFSIPTVVNGKVYLGTGFGLDVFGVIGPAAIATSPQDQTHVEGGEILLNVVATGTPPLKYQWAFNGVALEGQTQAWLQVLNAKSSDSGSYSVTVSNGSGSDTSKAAVVSIKPPLTLQLYPGLTINGNVGETYAIEYRTDFATTNWVTLGTVTLTNSTQLWLDLQSGMHGRGFYQTVRLP